MNSFNQYGNGNQQIGTQNNYYGQKNPSITIFIDIDLLEEWYKNNSIDVSSIMKSIKSAKMSYLKDEKTIITVETERLVSLQDTHENLIDADIFDDIEVEKSRCKKTERLIELINLNLLKIEEEFIILNILCKIFVSNILYCNNIYNNEKNKIKTFIDKINKEERKIEQCIENELIEWEKLNSYSDGYITNTKEKIEEARANFKKYLYNFSPEINTIRHQIKNDTELFAQKFENFYLWFNIPFRFKIIFEIDSKEKYEYIMFNIFLENHGCVNIYNENFLKYAMILNDKYLQTGLYYERICKTEDNLNLFYKQEPKETTVEYDEQQKQFRRIVQSYLHPSAINAIKSKNLSFENLLENIFFYYD